MTARMGSLLPEALPDRTGHGTGGRRYELAARIDRGGMGELYLAHMFEPDRAPRYVVIKTILDGLLEDEKYVKMFLAEADVMARLDHPNIVKLVDRPTFGGQPSLAMEYVQGRNVQQVLTALGPGRGMPPAIVLRTMSQVLRALEYAHDFQLEDGSPLNLVHRDVSPGNILISFDGEAKLTDFGISKHDMSGVETTAGIVKGKARYLSPEQVIGEEATPQSDIFSAACVIIEMLTGNALFDQRTVPKTLYAIASGEHPPVDSLIGFHAPLLVQLLTRALARRAEDRLTTARELAEGLEAAARLLGQPADRGAVATYLRQVFKNDRQAHEVEASREDASVGAKRGLLEGAALLAVEHVSEEARTEVAASITSLEPFLPGVDGAEPTLEETFAAQESAHASGQVSVTVLARSSSTVDVAELSSVNEALSVLSWIRSQRAETADLPTNDPAESSAFSAAHAPTERRQRTSMRVHRGSHLAVFALGLGLGVLTTLAGQAIARFDPEHDAARVRARSKSSARESPLTAAAHAELPLLGAASDRLAAERPLSLLSTATISRFNAAMAIPARDTEPSATIASPHEENTTGILELAEPKGAAVRLDGAWLKLRAPLRVDLPPGRHQARIVGRGFRQDVVFTSSPGERVDLSRLMRRHPVEP